MSETMNQPSNEQNEVEVLAYLRRQFAELNAKMINGGLTVEENNTLGALATTLALYEENPVMRDGYWLIGNMMPYAGDSTQE